MASTGAARRRLAVAASAGLDSTALLHCVHSMASRHGIEVCALHVNHGLHPDADAWQAQLQRQCQRWAQDKGGLVLAATRLQASPGKGESVEAWARRERYVALTAMAQEQRCTIVLLAHHRRDQAETVLLQALRGAGPAGLAAMPRAIERDGLWWLRPWLDQPRESIEAYVRRWRLAHVDDPANRSPRFARNRVRDTVLPALRSAFADAETVLAGVARRAQEAATVLAEVAAADAAVVVDARARLVLERWLALGPARRANLLRRWLGAAPDSLVERLLAELPNARGGRWPAPGGLELRLHAGALSLQELATPTTIGRLLTIDLSQPGCYTVPPWPGVLQVEAAGAAAGVPASLLQQAELRPRRGGERFQGRAAAPARSLKKQFQALGVDAWSRDGPLVYAVDLLLFVPGLGFDARALATPGADRRLLSWVR